MNPLRRGDVLHLRDKIERLAARAAHQRRVEHDPHHPSLLVDVALLALIRPDLTIEHAPHALHVRAQIVGVGDPLKVEFEEFCFGVSNDLAQRAIDLQPAPFCRQQPLADRTLLKRAAKQLTAFDQLRLRAPNVRDVPECRHRAARFSIAIQQRCRAAVNIGDLPVRKNYVELRVMDRLSPRRRDLDRQFLGRQFLPIAKHPKRRLLPGRRTHRRIRVHGQTQQVCKRGVHTDVLRIGRLRHADADRSQIKERPPLRDFALQFLRELLIFLLDLLSVFEVTPHEHEPQHCRENLQPGHLKVPHPSRPRHVLRVEHRLLQPRLLTLRHLRDLLTDRVHDRATAARRHDRLTCRRPVMLMRADRFLKFSKLRPCAEVERFDPRLMVGVPRRKFLHPFDMRAIFLQRLRIRLKVFFIPREQVSALPRLGVLNDGKCCRKC